MAIGALEGRVAIITGAGRGIGREHALFFASEGARIVVNDLGGGADGSGTDDGPAQQVVDEIVAAGGTAVANTGNVADWSDAKALVEQAVSEFGHLDVLVNNAGILRDSFLVSMSESEWDAVVNVHLKGHFATMRHAAEYWKSQSKSGTKIRASVVNTASPSGVLMPNPGQVNYGAAKAAIVSMTQVAAAELGRYGVRANVIAPGARTRMTENLPAFADMVKAPDDATVFDKFHPGNISPFVGYLATEQCPETGQAFLVQSGHVQRLHGWRPGEDLAAQNRRLTIADFVGQAVGV